MVARIRPPETCEWGYANCLLCDFSVEFPKPFDANYVAEALAAHECQNIYEAPKSVLDICDNN